MTYLLLICVGEAVQLTPEERAAMDPATGSWVAEMEARGIRKEGAPDRPDRDLRAASVRPGVKAGARHQARRAHRPGLRETLADVAPEVEAFFLPRANRLDGASSRL
jgi:hypothetical protein